MHRHNNSSLEQATVLILGKYVLLEVINTIEGVRIKTRLSHICYGSVCNKLITIVNYYLESGLFCIVY